VEWSWDLLDPEERLLARRLAVFAGGATVESAAAVCGLPAERVDDLLSGLADKSLVDSVGGRFRMLDTIGEFCAGRLVASGEEERIRAAHAGYFLELAREADSHLRRPEQLVWLERLTAEHGNLLAALRWGVRADTGVALALVGAAAWYWYLRGVREELAPLAASLLAAVGHEPPPDALEEYLLCVLGSGTTDPAHLARVREIVVTIPGPIRQPYAMVAWALYAGPPAADAELGPLQEWFATTEEPWYRGLFRFGIGMTAFYRGTDPAFAEAECVAALEFFRASGDRWGLAQALDALATIADSLGDAGKSLALTDQAIEVVGQLGAIEELADLHCRRADRRLRAGHDSTADYERSAELARRVGVPATLALAHSGLGELARRAGDLTAARRWHELALQESTVDWTGTGATAAVLIALGRVAEEEGAVQEARSCYARAVELAESNRMPTTAEDAVAGLARLGDQVS
jgi:tetratricopeptide (TPR) repeat protein